MLKQRISDVFIKIFNKYWLKFHRYIRVCLVGLVSMAIQFILFNLLRIRCNPTLANAIAIEFAIVNAFILNNIFTFKDRSLELTLDWVLIKHFVKFNLYSMVSLILQLVIVFLGTHLIKTNLFIENLLVFIGIVLGSIINYFIYSRLIWKQR